MTAESLRYFRDRITRLLQGRSAKQLACAFKAAILIPLLGRSAAHIRHAYYRLRWGKSAPDANRLIYVDPRSVQWIITPCFRPILTIDGTYIRGGQWDLCKENPQKNFDHPHDETFDTPMALVPIDRYLLFVSMKDHLANNTPWNRTEFYARRSDPRHTLHLSSDALDRYGEHIDELYDKLRTHGFKTQQQLISEFGPQKSGPFRGQETEEITLAIGRDGELSLDTRGRHRMFIAQILGIPVVPARVLVRHKAWQTKRLWVRKNRGTSVLERLDESALNHPDMRDVV